MDHYKPCCAKMMIGDRFFREITENCWEPARRIEDCDRCGVAMQVLSTLPVMFSYWAKPADCLELSRLLNDHIATLVRDHPGRFTGLGTIPLQDPELACRELERCVRELGLSGVQIGTHVDPNEFTGRRESWNLSDAALTPVFQTTAELKAAVFVHPWGMMGKERMTKYWLPWLVGMPAETSLAICSILFSGVLEKLPDLRIAFAHGGGSFPGTIGRIHHGFHARPDLCAVDNSTPPRDYLAHWEDRKLVRPARFYVDSLVHDEDMLRHIVRLFGAARVALGSDYPFPLGEAHPGGLIEAIADFSPEDKMMLLSGSARSFLGLP